MVRQKARGPFVWLRRALLILGLLCVVGLGVLLAAYRFGSSENPTPSASGSSTLETDLDTIESGQGFDHTQTSEGRPVFRIRAKRSRQDRDNTAFLEGVLLDVFRDNGETYHISSDRAVFSQSSDWAELEGHVVLSGWQDLEMRARALQVRQKGQVLTSDGEVEFQNAEMIGRASRMRVDRRTEFIIFSDGVHIQNLPDAEVELRLDCDRLAYRQGEGVVRALDDVYFRHGPHEIRTRALTVFLEPDGKEVQSLRARWDVVGSLRMAAEEAAEDEVGMVITYSGELLEMQPDAEGSGPRLVRLESADPGLVDLRATDPSGLVRHLRGEFLVGHLHQGQLTLVEGSGSPLTITEEIDVDPPHVLRRACAERGTARFLPSGDLARLDLSGAVEVATGDLQLSGASEAMLDLIEEQLDARGRAVKLVNDRGEVIAPHFSHSMKTGLIRADSGVQATLEEGAIGALDETPLGRGEGPVRVDAKEATWTVDPPTFAFRGEVRAWRGQNLLLAEQLRGDQASHTLAASGEVKTTWISDRLDPYGDPRPPIEVTAETLTYDRNRNLMIYDRDVELAEGSRKLACRTLDVELGADGGAAERMICRDKVRLVDPAAGHRVTGDRAVYTLAIDLVEIFGQPVTLIDADNKLEGRYLLYDVNAGTVQLRSQQPEGNQPPS